jgi:hypothetical protein
MTLAYLSLAVWSCRKGEAPGQPKMELQREGNLTLKKRKSIFLSGPTHPSRTYPTEKIVQRSVVIVTYATAIANVTFFVEPCLSSGSPNENWRQAFCPPR